MPRRMTQLVTLMLALLTIEANACEFPGSARDWVLDACLLENATGNQNDPAVLECTEAAGGQVTALGECESKTRFKNYYCSLKHLATPERISKCVADPEEQGPVVSAATG